MENSIFFFDFFWFFWQKYTKNKGGLEALDSIFEEQINLFQQWKTEKNSKEEGFPALIHQFLG